MNFRRLMLVASAFLWLSACNEGKETLPIVGIDNNGKSVETTVAVDDYVQQLATTMNELNQSTLNVIHDLPPQIQRDLDSLSVGLGLRVKFKIPFLVTLASGSRIRLTYANSHNPEMP